MLEQPEALWNPRVARFLSPLIGVRLLLLGVLPACALVVAFRRGMLGRWNPLELPATLVTAAVLLGILLACRLAMRRSAWRERVSTAISIQYLPTIILGLWAVACSFPGTQPLAWVIWGGAVAIDQFAARRLDDHSKASPATTPASESTHFSDSPEEELASSDRTSPSPPLGDGETVLQQVMRIRDESGREYVYATLRGEFEPGQRTTHVFVGFCPPFPEAPQVEAEVIDGAGAVAKVVQALHNGAQIEVDLDAPSMDRAHVTVELAAFVATEEIGE